VDLDTGVPIPTVIPMSTYIAQVAVAGETVQNPQEFVAAWGTINEDIERLDGEILETFAVLGPFDFHVLFDVEDSETALQVSQIIESQVSTRRRWKPFPSTSSANSWRTSDSVCPTAVVRFRSPPPRVHSSGVLGVSIQKPPLIRG
jgi:uncharacterized protein with GYD domain